MAVDKGQDISVSWRVGWETGGELMSAIKD